MSGFFSGTQKDVNLFLFRNSTNIEMRKWNCVNKRSEYYPCELYIWTLEFGRDVRF